jgi:hypothetical protein
MTDESNPVNSEAVNSVDSTNISVADFAHARLGQIPTEENIAPQETEEVVEESVQDEPLIVDAETDSVEETEEESADDVLSQMNLDEMSEDDLRELADKLGSRAVARFGELTAKRKQAEEELARIKSEMQKEDPLNAKKPVEDNPFNDLNTVEELQSKSQEMDGVIEWAEDLIFNSDGYGPEDVVTEVNGSELTKAQVRQTLRNARKTKDTFLPDRLNQLQIQAQSVQLKSQFADQAKKELTWMGNEEDDINQKYLAMMDDPRMKKLEAALPEVSAQIPYLIAHAANSLYGRKPVGSMNPPKSGIPSSSVSDRSTSKKAQSIKQVSQQFRDSGNKNDFIRLRTLQLSQNK